jgi:predicted AlkP superfamily phosphohydrolase/phosphomutase
MILPVAWTRLASRTLAASAGVLALIVASFGCNSSPTVGRRVIVLGFDGLDYELTRQMIESGQLPAFAQLARRGGFTPLGTTVPAQSPVAWSSFITGLDPGQHGIFDFVHRDPKTMLPYLSTTRTESADRTIPIGRWQLPLSSGKVELLRRGQPFWEVLEDRGVPTTIIRMPANFPPSGTATRELSGMGTPDLLGTYGTFSFYTSDWNAFAEEAPSGGVAYHVRVRAGRVRAYLEGPENPFLRAPEKVQAEFYAYPDRSKQFAKIVVGPEQRLLKVGEWSDWVPVEFSLAPTQTLPGQVRFFLKALDPYFELYASPVNIDPANAAMPVSTPPEYASELADATGRFYTQGMPEDTKGLRTGVLTDADFLSQARLAGEEIRAQYRYVLNRFDNGFLFYYFGNVDQVSHMMWRARDPQHPAFDPAQDGPHAGVVEELYRGLDAVVADTLEQMGPDDLLVVMSDHGFTSWRRSFHLNSWLRDNGYIKLKDPARTDAGDLFDNVDWSRTRAYALGLNGLYVNLKGRERDGIVLPSEREALVQELSAKLLAVIDPATGTQAITKAYRREQVYTLTDVDEIAPDLVVGYAKGTRGSDESALGAMPPVALVDNTSHWSGDHCMDADAVPGILLSSRALKRPAATLQQLPAALVSEFGVDSFPQRRPGR